MKNPTPKQVRSVMKKIYYHQSRLNRALWEAKHLGVVQYKTEEVKEKAPGVLMFDLDCRIADTTESALANAMRVEILKGIK